MRMKVALIRCSQTVRQMECPIIDVLYLNTIYHCHLDFLFFQIFIMSSVAIFLLIAVTAFPGKSNPVERDKDVINSEQIISMDISHKNNENESKLNDYAEYEDDDEMSVYKLLEKEDETILTEIEKLYTAFVHDHLNEVPLLRILAQKPHSLTIMVQPKLVHPNTMVRLLCSENHINSSQLTG
jgi:hypothetical protein